MLAAPATESPLSNKIKKLDLSLNFDTPSETVWEEEPLLVTNTKRFVLFPIQYQAVSGFLLVRLCLLTYDCIYWRTLVKADISNQVQNTNKHRFGKRTRMRKLNSGLPKKLN